jgi:uncharacterized protein (DUF3820 family)
MLKPAATRMPFGKYRDRLPIDLPEPDAVWFANKGFPEIRLGRMLRAVCEIKIKGLEYLCTPFGEVGQQVKVFRANRDNFKVYADKKNSNRLFLLLLEGYS